MDWFKIFLFEGIFLIPSLLCGCKIYTSQQDEQQLRQRWYLEEWGDLTINECKYLQALGWSIAHRNHLEEMGLNCPELDEVIKGLRLGTNHISLPFNVEELHPAMEAYFREKIRTYRILMKHKENIMKQEKSPSAFFENLDQMPTVQKTNSGLRYEILKEGNGKQPSRKSTVIVHYEGKLIDGKIFDSSYARREPATFRVTDVIPGFAEGLLLTQEKGKTRLYIPANLAYGDADLGIIPPQSPLIFEIELLKVD